MAAVVGIKRGGELDVQADREQEGGSTRGLRALLSIADIVALYGVSRSFVYSLKRFIPWYRFGGVKYRREDIERYLELHRKVVPQLQGVAKPKTAPRAPGTDVVEAHDRALAERYGV